ncbi:MULTISPECIES: hypothetical protein [unclassified Aureispira]|uniref:hypothetical protein n=1 Tax=unclassified Aureispira TaxID=2649989 RepID=UPI0006980B68|nr:MULTISPECIES: hypothetical protein [unclassified Aureispira]WMX14753.1 hypothetical protein QP953_00015 [Aureispira sp. CCB-E]
MSIKYSEQSRIFRDFRSIPYSDYYYLIRFYEQYDQDISDLPFDEGLIMSYYYANALFETQEYDTHIAMSNYILEQSIIHNVRYIDGEDVYMTVLHKKTYSHLKLEETETAQNLATQLVRLDPSHYLYHILLRQCFSAKRPTWIRPLLTMSAVSTIMGAIVTIIFSSFYLSLPAQAILIPYSLLLVAMIGLTATAWGYYKYIMAPVRKILKQAQIDKANNQEI